MKNVWNVVTKIWFAIFTSDTAVCHMQSCKMSIFTFKPCIVYIVYVGELQLLFSNKLARPLQIHFVYFHLCLCVFGLIHLYFIHVLVFFYFWYFICIWIFGQRCSICPAPLCHWQGHLKYTLCICCLVMTKCVCLYCCISVFSFLYFYLYFCILCILKEVQLLSSK